jgi:hypothetical protein
MPLENNNKNSIELFNFTQFQISSSEKSQKKQLQLLCETECENDCRQKARKSHF